MKEIIFENVVFHIGQNCSENDNLFKTMPDNSIWFHLDSQTSSHVYCISNNKLTKKDMKEVIKKGAELVRLWSKKTGKVIYIKKNKLKSVGPGIVELLDDPNYT